MMHALRTFVATVSASMLIASWALPARAGFDVNVNGQNVGTISFHDYSTVQGNPDEYSITLQGGYSANGTWTLPTGYQYYWIQTVQSTDPIYSWQTDPSRTYIDRTRYDIDAQPPTTQPWDVDDGSPFYKFYRGPVSGYSTLGFSDTPSRDVRDFGPNGSGTWSLTLVIANSPPVGTKGDIFALTTIQWGFTVSNGILTRHDLTQVDPASTQLSNAFYGDPDTATFRDSWNLHLGLSPTPSVPEPSSLVLAGVGLCVAGAVGVRRRYSAAA